MIRGDRFIPLKLINVLAINYVSKTYTTKKCMQALYMIYATWHNEEISQSNDLLHMKLGPCHETFCTHLGKIDNKQ
jgi:hypothetical protein